MNLKQLQEITLIPTGETYDNEIIKYFKINPNQTIEKVKEDISKVLNIRSDIQIKKWTKVGRRFYSFEQDFLECTYEQFTRLDTILVEENNVGNLHKLISIYFRPVNWFGKIKKFDMRTQEKISNDLLSMDMNLAQSLILFFYQNANKCLDNIKISYLNHNRNE